MVEEDSQTVDNILDDDDVEPDTTAEDEEDQDELGDDELQSMLQDYEASPGAMTDTGNTDWYPCNRAPLSCPSVLYDQWHLVMVTFVFT